MFGKTGEHVQNCVCSCHFYKFWHGNGSQHAAAAAVVHVRTQSHVLYAGTADRRTCTTVYTVYGNVHVLQMQVIWPWRHDPLRRKVSECRESDSFWIMFFEHSNGGNCSFFFNSLINYIIFKYSFAKRNLFHTGNDPEHGLCIFKAIFSVFSVQFRWK